MFINQTFQYLLNTIKEITLKKTSLFKSKYSLSLSLLIMNTSHIKANLSSLCCDKILFKKMNTE